MSASLNKVLIIGFAGKDAELRYTQSGVAVATFSIATNEHYKGSDGNPAEKTEWHNIVCWRKLAEVCGEYLKKGTKVYVEGKLQTRTWEKEGQKHYSTDVVADKVMFLDSRGAQSSSDTTAEESGEVPF